MVRTNPILEHTERATDASLHTKKNEKLITNIGNTKSADAQRLQTDTQSVQIHKAYSPL